MTDWNGVLPVDKPAGPTSHDVVARARRALRLRRIGHTGTLDPFASGLLLLCLGPSTRLAEYLTALPKRYEATLRLGVATDTDDAEGEVVRTSDGWPDLETEAIHAAFLRQTGDIEQVPPQYSAKRVDGERMYDVARRGGTVALAAVPVHVESIEVTRVELPEVDFRVACSSGTYIRAIARDVGLELGVGAHLTSLRRTSIGRFEVESALPLEALDDSAAGRVLIPPADAVGHLRRVDLTASEVEAIRTGRAISRDTGPEAGPVAIVSPDGALAAIGEAGDGEVRPRKVFL